MRHPKPYRVAQINGTDCIHISSWQNNERTFWQNRAIINPCKKTPYGNTQETPGEHPGNTQGTLGEHPENTRVTPGKGARRLHMGHSKVLGWSNLLFLLLFFFFVFKREQTLEKKICASKHYFYDVVVLGFKQFQFLYVQLQTTYYTFSYNLLLLVMESFVGF